MMVLVYYAVLTLPIWAGRTLMLWHDHHWTYAVGNGLLWSLCGSVPVGVAIGGIARAIEEDREEQKQLACMRRETEKHLAQCKDDLRAAGYEE